MMIFERKRQVSTKHKKTYVAERFAVWNQKRQTSGAKNYPAMGLRAGYTIVEVMVFIGITGVLFIIAFSAIGDKQAQAQFTQSVRDFESKIGDLMNDVSTGVYPNSDKVTCQLSGAQGSQVKFVDTVGSSPAGTNLGCIFIGKVLQFNKDAADYNIITVAGTRITDQGQESSNIAEAHPRAVVNDTSAPTTPVTNLTETGALSSGLRVTDVITYDKPTSSTTLRLGAIGLFTSFPQYNSSAIAGALSTNVIDILGTNIGSSLTILPPAPTNNEAVVYTNLIDVSSNYHLNPTVILCLEQGGRGSNGRRAALIIGNNGRVNTSELHIGDVVQAVDKVDGSVDGSLACVF